MLAFCVRLKTGDYGWMNQTGGGNQMYVVGRARGVETGVRVRKEMERIEEKKSKDSDITTDSRWEGGRKIVNVVSPPLIQGKSFQKDIPARNIKIKNPAHTFP